MQMDDFMSYDFDVSDVKCVLIKGCKSHIPFRTRFENALIYYPEGGCIFTFNDGQVVKTEKNMVVFMPVGACYEIENYAPKDCYSITFTLGKPFDCKPFSMSVRNATYFLEMFSDAERTCRQAKAGYVMSSKARLCSIIAALQHEYSLGYVSNRKYAVIAPAVEMIHQSYTGDVPSVSELAESCGITPEYLRALFRKKYGKSPVKYINDLRFARARELLDSGLYTITEAAHLSGFSEASYFSKEFKKKYGVTPSAYVTSEEFISVKK